MQYIQKVEQTGSLSNPLPEKTAADFEDLIEEQSYSIQPSLKSGQRRLRTETNYAAIQHAHVTQTSVQPTIQYSPYSDLICTEHDKKLIEEHISTLAKHNHFWFVIHAHELKKIMKTLTKRVHVLKILETVFTTPKLQKSITKICNDEIKWEAVVNATKERMTKAERGGPLHIYAKDFAISIGASPTEVEAFFLRKDWEGLLNYLVVLNR